jgi:hypothetical protein
MPWKWLRGGLGSVLTSAQKALTMQPNKLRGAWLCALILSLATWFCGVQGATITVTSTSDSGAGTLRQAVTDANSGDQISITATGTITLSSQVVIAKSLSIVGPGKANLTISGGTNTRIFRIDSGTVTIQNVTLANGRVAGGNGTNAITGGAGGGGGAAGGAVFIASGVDATFELVDFNSNSAIGGTGGSTSAGNNYAGGAGGSGAAGGGTSGTAGGTTFWAGGGAAGSGAGSGGGGGAAGDGAAAAGGNGGALGGGAGGGGNSGTGGIGGSPGSAGLFGGSGATGTTPYLGAGGAGGGGGALGGAVCIMDGAYVAFKRAAFSSNTATGGSAGTGGSTAASAGKGKGAAIFTTTGSIIEIYECTFTGNSANGDTATATTYDGAVLDNDNFYGRYVDGPLVRNVTSTATNGVYNAAEVIPVQVTYSQVVTATGTPQLTLETGASDALVNYTSGSGSKTLTFNYTVASGHVNGDLDYASATPINLNGGSLVYVYNSISYNAATFYPTPGGTGSLSANRDLDVEAGTWLTVTNANDTGAGSLRQTISNAVSGDRIHFAAGLAGQTITLASELLVDKDLVISGFDTNGVAISGNNACRIFNVVSATLQLRGLTLKNGAAANGGGISVGGAGSKLQIVQCLVRDCQSTGLVDDYEGYGSAVLGSQAAISITNSTFVGNNASYTGTISDWYASTIDIRHCTIIGNSAADATNGSGGLTVYDGTIRIYDTILAGDTGVKGEFFSEGGGTLVSLGHNLSDSNPGSALNASGDLPNKNLATQIKLSALADNGGPTQTRALPSDSVAVNAGDNSNPYKQDQRGLTRIDNSTIDIGAFEYQSAAANAAPTWTGNGTLSAVAEDTASPSGATITTLLGGAFSDSDSGSSMGGVAVVGNSANASTQGVWQYSTNSGTNWYDIGTVNDTASALALSAATMVRFMPVANFSGAPTALTVRALDNSYVAGFTNGATRVTVSTSSNGNATAISANTATISTSITSVNDAPSFSAGATLAAVNEDTANPAGATLSALLGSAFVDVDSGSSMGGVAVIGNTANASTEGAWEYSTDSGGNWYAVGTVADNSSALALAASTLVRFKPVANYNGTPASLTVRAIDNTYVSGYTSGVTRATLNAASNGGSTAISAGSVTLGTSITAVNDAPTITQGASTSVTMDEDASPQAFSLTLNASDVEGNTLTWSVVTPAGHGTAGASGTGTSKAITYTPNANYNGSDSFVIGVSDGQGGSAQITVNVTINAQNDTPTDMQLSQTSVAENEPSGTTVGTLSATDIDTGDTFTYGLVTGTGDTDNGAFNISGSSLQTAQSFDFETKSNYSIRVRVTDSGSATYERTFTISVSDVNEAPQSIALSQATVAENTALGSNIGTLSAVDPDASDSQTFTLVSGTGSDDNGSFSIVGDMLQVNTALDCETKSTYAVRVRSTDSGSLFVEQAFVITVTDVNEAPTAVQLSHNAVAENQTSGTLVGTLSSVDEDTTDTHTYALVAGAGDTDNTAFSIVGDALNTAASFDYETQASYSVRVRTTDAANNTAEETFTIVVANLNDTPMAVLLSPTAIAENATTGTTVGTLSATDQDTTDTHTFTLVAGAGDTDNALFSISGDALQTAAMFDNEAQSSYTVRVRATDVGAAQVEQAFVITILNVNDAPTAIQLSNSQVAENEPTGTVVGTLSSSDQDTTNTHGYTLVSGTGDTDNTAFSIVGDSLQTAQSFNFEAKSSYSVRVRSSDDGGALVEAVFTINIANVNDTPTSLQLNNQQVNENEPSGTVVGALSASDDDSTDTLTYSLVTGTGDTDNAAFTIAGTQLQTAQVFDYETKSTYSIRVRVSDAGGLYAEQTYAISVVDQNDSPTLIQLSNSSVNENEPIGTVVGTLSATDQDASDTLTYTLVAGSGDTDNAAFNIVGDQLQTTQSFDFETKSSYSIRVRVTDSALATDEQTFVIGVTDVNDGPTGLSLTPAAVDENATSGTLVGQLASDDQDTSDTHSHALVTGVGDTDNAAFTISGDQLLTAVVFDYEAQSTRSVRIRSTDGQGATIEQAFVIQIRNLNDAPTALLLAGQSVAENQPAGTVVGALGVTDQDTTDTHTYSLVTGAGDSGNGAFSVVGNQLQTVQNLDYEAQASYSIRLRVTDAGGAFIEANFIIQVLNENETPTVVQLAGGNIAENLPAGTLAGTLSVDDPDTTDTHSYSLVAGVGDTDNAAFTINGDQLLTAAAFDYETQATYAVRVRATDAAGNHIEQALTIHVLDVNEDPTALLLSQQQIAENLPVSSVVGTLATTDQDTTDTHSYALVAGSGDADNSAFSISGDQLRTAQAFDYEQRTSYTVRIRTSDAGGKSLEVAFLITITDVNDVPTVLQLSGATLAENQPVGTLIGTLSATDQDSSETLTFSLVAGTGDTDNAAFALTGNQLKSAALFDFESRAAYNIRVRVSDHGNLFSEQSFTITIQDANDVPLDLVLNNHTVAGNAPAGTVVGTFSSVDQDHLDQHLYTLVAGAGDTDNSQFALVGNELRTVAALHAIDGPRSVRINTNDQHGGQLARQFDITVLPESDTAAPLFATALSVASITDRSAVLNWSTDEPAVAVLHYGTTSDTLNTLALTTFTLSTNQTLDGLTSNTVYYARVGVTDQTGNGPRLSELVSFRTGSLSDVHAPVIIDGPLATTISDTYVEIRWTTDEPATSKITFNDGSVVGMREDGNLVTLHSIVLAGLTPATAYQYTVTSFDGAGNPPGTAGPLNFRTLAQPDVDKPIIVEGPLVVSVTQNSATVVWRTDEPATSLVEFGSATGGAKRQISVADLTQYHQVKLTGLATTTAYRFNVQSYDIYGNGPVKSRDIAFRTLAAPDTTAPRILDGPRVIGVSDRTATIYWRTDEPSDSTVYYGIGSTLNQTRRNLELVTEHQLTLVDLQAGGAYQFAITSTDPSGNSVSSRTPTGVAAGRKTASDSAFQTMLLPDTTPPQFAEEPHAVSISDRSVVLQWATNELADVRIEYWVNGSSDKLFVGDIQRRTSQTVTLTNLLPATTYKFQIAANDVSGNLTQDAERTFLTTIGPDVTPPTILNPVIDQIGQHQARITWQTDELATTEARYGLTSGTLDQVAAISGTDTNHELNLGNLTPATLYYVQIASADGLGNQSLGSVLSLRTAAYSGNVRLDLLANPGSVTAGDTIQLQVKLSNLGATTATGLTTLVSLPAHLEVTTAALAAGWVTEVDGTTASLTWASSLPPSTVTSVTLQLRVDPDLLTGIADFAMTGSLMVLGTDWVDADASDDISTATVAFIAPQGTLNIQPSPAEAAWHLTGPGTDTTGTGSRTFGTLLPGDYQVAWMALSGWLAPQTEIVHVRQNETVTVTGTYRVDVGYYLSFELPFGSSYQVGDLMRVHWVANLMTIGTVVRIELWRNDAFVTRLGTVWDPDGDGESDEIVLAVPPGDNYHVRVVSDYNPALWVESAPVSISGYAVTVNLTAPFAHHAAGGSLGLQWQNVKILAGTAVGFELWDGNGFVADLGADWNEAAQHATTVMLPNVPIRTDYRVRAISMWDETLWGETAPFVIWHRNAVEGAGWSQYE